MQLTAISLDKAPVAEQAGREEEAFMFIIQSTDNWPEEAQGRARGQGLVHDYLIKNVLGIERGEEINNKKRICCGGFGTKTENWNLVASD